MRVISGKFKGRKLQRPSESITRPTSDRVRESIFNILTHLPGFSFEGLLVLDVFAGSGAMGLEALSRGALQVKLIDRHPEVLKILQQNVKTLDCHEKVEILNWDALLLPLAAIPVDLIFIDPPYHQNFESIVIEQIFKKGWVKEGTLIVLETAKNTSFDFINIPGSILTVRTFANTKITIFSCSGLQNPS